MTAQEIREWLSRYLAGELALEEFEDWFLPATWDLTPEQDPQAYDLAAQIRLWLAEHDSGHRTEEELRTLLARKAGKVKSSRA